jgi:hypothetical protein
MQAIPQDDQWGIDSVTCSFNVDGNRTSTDIAFWEAEDGKFFSNSGKSYNSLVTTLKKEFADVRVTLFPNHERCKLQFNAARLISPKSPTLFPPEALKAQVKSILEGISDFITPIFDTVDSSGTILRLPNWADYVAITRLDCARNFYISDEAAVKSAIARVTPKNYKVKHTYEDSTGGWTVSNETSDSGKDRLYDKAAELADKKVEDALALYKGLFRFETQLENDRLNKFGLKKLSHVTDERVWNAIDSRWDACRWGVSLYEQGTLRSLLSGLTVANQESLLGYLSMAEHGWTGGMTKQHIAQKNKVAHGLGLIPGKPISEMGVVHSHLDLFAGCLVPV